ncbi:MULTISPECIES: hypothetical protein [Streptomyces]|uniref:Uncharacterized protein n=1 Tax=Streptomyces nymphaeiformis TaxID=2663842 RepID=A0A7W7XAL2_9ACTN|nr:hypothetical protein [Streptomyces nymphaeiformis]MBB4981065.1 hypothetical protein [Streptomyces nymphaeiformis]
MNKELTSDPAAVARHERFGRLPERIGFESMTEEKPAEPSAGANARYNPEASWNYFSCLALDLGL